MSVSSLRTFEYLAELPGTTKNRLYKQPSAVLAIFRRMLPHLAKNFVMALLYISKPMLVTDLNAWVRPESKHVKDEAINVLERLLILSTIKNPGKAPAYGLANNFATSLRLALSGGGNHNSFGVPCHTKGQDTVTVPALDEFARMQWEGVLGYMVGSTGIDLANEGIALSPSVTILLQAGHLVEVRGKKVEITQDGFAFVLQEVNAQVWTMLILYIESADKLGMDEVDVLSFLFMLGSLELGLPYSKANLTATQTRMLEDLSDFGLIHQPTPTAPHFYPTRLATTLSSDASGLRSSSLGNQRNKNSATNNTGFIVIETNYRIYAYTSSNLQIAILQLFARLQTRYPNMIAGKITRESIRHAVAMGITSDQIITYLTTHAHPQMQNHKFQQSTTLPPTVVDQIRLWQLEGDRMKTTHGFLFKDFGNQAEFEAPCRYAEEIGVLVWKNEGRRMFFVTRLEQVAGFVRARSEKKG